MVSLGHQTPRPQDDTGAGALVEMVVHVVLAAGAVMNEDDFVALALGVMLLGGFLAGAW